jgi:hypothetical protein
MPLNKGALEDCEPILVLHNKCQKRSLLSKFSPRKTNEFVGIKIILKMSPVWKLYLSL